MELQERAGFLSTLQTKSETVAAGEGHCIFVSGEAGIGKTSLVKAFCRERKNEASIYQGFCDALFTPRPLAPLFDIAWQIGGGLGENTSDMTDRAGLFARVFQELGGQKKPIVLVFEDIHWADEATLDFIKFLARRITRLRCLFILTYRDDEIHSHHPLRTVLGQLSPDSFTRLQLTPLSRQTVEHMAEEKGFSGKEVYGISGGNPFYVTEILASYSPGVPDNIKDAILAVYNRQDEETKSVWKILSVLPAGFEMAYLEKIEPSHKAAIERSLDAKIVVVRDGVVFFKHELYRRTIEASLSPFVRVSLNKLILDLFRENFEQHRQTERIIHHAKNANEYELVVQYAPLAAREAASIGAHIEASKLYFSAIEYYQGKDKDLLLQLYEAYAYECYLTNRIKEAIIYQGKSLSIRREKGDMEKTGDCLRFLSRLWWYDGNRKQAETYGNQAIDVLDKQPTSKARAMAYSNMSQLKMLSDLHAECIHWGEKAIAMAEELGDEEILSHALNNVGTSHMEAAATHAKGVALLQQSLAIALKNAYHEHAARAYTNLGSNSLRRKDYAFAKKELEAGIRYCDERDLGSWATYMLSCMARLQLETGHWDEALRIADNLIKNQDGAPIVRFGALVVAATVQLRRGIADPLPLLEEAKTKAFEMQELQRINPVMAALLEYEWITGKVVIEPAAIDLTIKMIELMGTGTENSEFAFWLMKARQQEMSPGKWHEGYQVNTPAMALKAARLWEEAGCPYMQALCLSEGNETNKKEAITMVHKLGAVPVYEKMKLEMRASGIKSIPRGIRKTTQANPAQLTGRELDVLQLLKEGLQNKEIAAKLFISAKTVDHHISAILFKLDVNSRAKAAQEAIHLAIIK